MIGMQRLEATSMVSLCTVALPALRYMVLRVTPSWARHSKPRALRKTTVVHTQFGTLQSTEDRAWTLRKWVPKHVPKCLRTMALLLTWTAEQTNSPIIINMREGGNALSFWREKK